MQTREKFIKNALAEFLRRHSADASVSAIDDIVLSYMISILEELGNSSVEDEVFDVDQFTEMMEAYLPGFQDFNSIEVSEWMFELASQLSNLTFNADSPSNSSDCELPALSCLDMSAFRLSKSAPQGDLGQNDKEPDGPKRIRSRSASSATSNSVSSDSDEVHQEDLDTLREMFPDASTTELVHCLVLSDGDLESAAIWVLHRQDMDESLAQSSKDGQKCRSDVPEAFGNFNDHHTKKSILAKYSYVDTDEDKKQHRPTAPKSEPKKLVRYLDSKVVSVKGERFTEIKKPEDDEAKNTFINLKPARQYRFH